MQESFASFWLSRAALVVMVVYVSSALRIWRLAPKITVNRIAALLCLDLAVWALHAAISYSADDPAVTVLLAKLLSWSWPFFPALGLHLAIEIVDTEKTLKLPVRHGAIFGIYSSALLFSYLLAGPLLRGAIRRAGYWSVDLVSGTGYAAFSIYYVSLNVMAIVIVAMAWFKAKKPIEKSRLGILFTTHSFALAGGFTTDTILAALGVDFPKVGVLWASIWVVGLKIAMERFGFLAPFSPRDTGLLMNRFIEQSMDGIMVSDVNGKVIYWNAPLVELTGIPTAEAVGQAMNTLQESMIPAGKDINSITDMVSRAIRKQLEGRTRLVEFEIRHRNGSMRWLQSNVFTIPGTDGDISAFILRDITREKLAAAEDLERIRRQNHAQKMEALGSLAGGIAHDFNNTLAGIMGAVSLMQATIDADDGSGHLNFSRELEVINRSAQRAASSIRGLMAFATNTPHRNEPFNLVESLIHMKEFTERTLSRSIRIVAPGLPEAAKVSGDPSQIEQLILNFIINAEHAMTFMRPTDAIKGGTITLAIRVVEADASFVATHPAVKQVAHWVLSVQDEGVGMDKKTLARIFDPFFTTKGTDQGNGLGLSMSHLIARQHGGFIEAESEPGVGSTFSLYLPAVES